MAVFRHLQIRDTRERWLVGAADVALTAGARLGSIIRTAQSPHGPPRRILLLRLERIGDLLMTLEAIAAVRSYAPHAHIDLVVGSWNTELARLIPAVDSVETLDAPWMRQQRLPSRVSVRARGIGADRAAWVAIGRQAHAWRWRCYDIAINFEPDIRSNILLALSGASRRVGFYSGGGGGLLDASMAPDPAAHIATNAKQLVARAFAGAGATQNQSGPLLQIPDAARRWAAGFVQREGVAGRPIVGIQPAAGRKVKEWDPSRFAETGAALGRTRGAGVILIGSHDDHQALAAMKAAWPPDVRLVELPADTGLVGLAAILERLDLFITGDTGPMHLAAAVGTPLVAIFGPSLPSRYAPLSKKATVVRIDLPCSPCNRMRQPPERCVGIVPDCLSGITTAQVLAAANEMLDQDRKRV